MSDVIYIPEEGLESGLRFGPYSRDECFYIEKSNAYQKTCNHEFEIVEFCLYRSKSSTETICLIEAKSSIPRNSDIFFAEVKAKISSSLLLLISSCLNRNDEAHQELPTPYQALDLSKTRFKFFLVIKDIPDEYLEPINEKFRESIKPIRKSLFEKGEVAEVLNERRARKYGLIRDAQ